MSWQHVGLGWMACDRGLVGPTLIGLLLLGACEANSERVAELEQDVRQLDDQVAALKTTLAAQSKPGAGGNSPASLPFKLACPTPFQVVASLGGGVLWTCRSHKPSPEGPYAQCNVLHQSQHAIEPKDYFEQALNAVPPLNSVQNYKDEPVKINEQPAFQSTYEAQRSASTTRALATLVPRGEEAYVISCQAPAASYSQYEPIFQQISASFQFR
ncbi:MAG: hypothetical protein ABW321_18825 [Polyangiales bacterium]